MRLVPRVRCALFMALLLVPSLAFARVISYSPYTNRTAYPLEQARTNRYFALYELTSASDGQVVLYDSTGVDEPRVVFPAEGKTAFIFTGAVVERNGVPSLLIEATVAGGSQTSWYFSSDGGNSWKTVNLPLVTSYLTSDFNVDVGGPIVRARYNFIRLGNDAMPFVIGLQGSIGYVNADGSAHTIPSSSGSPISLLGRNREGTKFLFRNSTGSVSLIDMSSNVVTPVASYPSTALLEGWITSTNAVYLDVRTYTPLDHFIVRFDGGSSKILLEYPINDGTAAGVFAIPTADYEGAWLMRRASGIPTTLYQQSGMNDPVAQWSDVTSPEVEALHAGASGNTLLIQVHRPRLVDTARFLDPALALWHTGDPVPRAFDELFMNEQPTKRFVHLDVDKIAAGDPFVFDSGAAVAQPVGIPISFPLPPPSGGGSDVLQEWGIVRASLKQKLVLPGMARTHGVFNSYWQSDVVIYNPAADPQNVRIDYVPTGDSFTTSDAKTVTLTLAGKEIRVIPDALKALFDVDSGGGAFFITPDLGVNVTSRTYTTGSNGTYGFGMNGIDFYGGTASPRFPVTFAGAFPGPNFRTNVVITDTSGRGTEATFAGAGLLGAIGTATPRFSAPPNGQVQLNGVTPTLGILDSEAGALVVQPTRGTAIASVVAIDNRTNDPTYFPPDLPASVVRTIPAIGHLDGVNGSKFRSDLYLYNPATQSRTVTMQAKAWDQPENPTSFQFTLLPGEARIIPDALLKLFGKTGIARLRYQSLDVSLSGQAVRVTSRTYSVDENGGTYGFLMPPFNNFQMGTSGDTLEILGVVGGKGFRTNLGLVDCSPWPNGGNVQARVDILDDKGRSIDSFTMNVPSAGGVQVNDLFHARALGDGPTAALIRVSPITGMIGAYATMNDNGTNDPTYLAANLAAQ